MSEQLNGNSPKLNYNDKELLYNLFYEIISEIKNCKIEIDEDEYINNIKSIQPKQLIEYLHHSIKILLKKKFEDGRELQRKEEKNTKIKKKIPFDNDYIFQLENSLQKLEEKERNYTRLIFKYKLQKEAMRNKISNLLDIEDEYEEMKSKLKYEDGRFLENDRKDNEILILKKENSSLKKGILKLEKNYKELKESINIDQNIIDELKIKNEKLNNLVTELKKEHFQNMRSNSSINLNIINNNNINPNKNKKNGIFLKPKNTFFNTPKSNYNLESFQNNINQSYMRKKEFTIDNTSSTKTNYNKIFNLNKKNIHLTKKNKSRSISMLLDDYEKRDNYFWMNNSNNNKIISNLNGKSDNKNNKLVKYKLSTSNKNESLVNLRNIHEFMPNKLIKRKVNIKGNIISSQNF